MEAVLPHHLGIRLALGLLLGQPHVLDALAIALVPLQGGERLQPVRCHGGHCVERRPEGFRHERKTVQHPDSREHMRGVGALRPARLEPAHGAAPLEQLLQQELCRVAGQEAVAELAEHGKVKAGIRQL